MRAAMVASALLVAGGCRTLGPPPEALADLLPVSAPESPELRRRTAWVHVESPEFRGAFRAVMLEERAPSPRVRLQLIPDVGGKVLDLVARADGECVGYWPHRDLAFRGAIGGDAPARRGLDGFLCITILEGAAPLTLDRVRAGRRIDTGFELRVSAAAGPSVRLLVQLDEEGRVERRSYRYAGVTWVEELAPVHEIRAPGFRWRLEAEASEGVDALPPALFELQVPAGVGS